MNINIPVDDAFWVLGLLLGIYATGRLLDIVHMLVKHWLDKKGRYHDAHGNSLPKRMVDFFRGEIPITDAQWMWRADKALGGDGKTSRLQRRIQVFCEMDFSINRRDIELLKVIQSLLDRLDKTQIMPPN